LGTEGLEYLIPSPGKVLEILTELAGRILWFRIWIMIYGQPHRGSRLIQAKHETFLDWLPVTKNIV
jgi:hypothetical protein